MRSLWQSIFHQIIKQIQASFLLGKAELKLTTISYPHLVLRYCLGTRHFYTAENLSSIVCWTHSDLLLAELWLQLSVWTLSSRNIHLAGTRYDLYALIDLAGHVPVTDLRSRNCAALRGWASRRQSNHEREWSVQCPLLLEGILSSRQFKFLWISRNTHRQLHRSSTLR
jgi:hypothetical protein